MAARYWVGGTANWDVTAGTKWALTSGGAGGASVPTSSDDVFFDAASGAITCTQTAGISFLSINFTGFTGTFASSGATTIAASGNITFDAGMTITSTSNLSVNATSTITSNGKTWTGNFNIGATVTITLADNFTVASLSSNGSLAFINGNTLNVLGSITMTQNMASGTTNINLIGTGTWSGSGTIKNNLTIKSTAIIDIVGNVQFNTGTFIVESGAKVNASNSSLIVAATYTTTTTFDISAVKLNNFYLGGLSTVNTLQLNSPLYITGTAYLGAGSQNQTINGSPVYIESGTLSSQAGNGGGILGTSQIIMTGDKATYLDSATPLFQGQGIWRIPITINVRGTILMYGRLVISTGGSFAILNGKVDHRDGLINKSSLLITASTTLTNIDKCKFKNIIITAGVTLTMNKFFTGSPEFKSVIRSNGTTNYNITFTDGVPKKAFHVNIKNATITNRNQLNVINRDGNAGNNLGILFGESGINGFPLNQYKTENSYPTESGFLQGGMNN